MEGNDLLLAQDYPLTAMECSGIDCPEMIKEDTLVGEQENDQLSDGKELKEFLVSEKETNDEEKKDEEKNDDARQTDQVDLREPHHGILEARVALESNEGYTVLTEHLRSENASSEDEGGIKEAGEGEFDEKGGSKNEECSQENTRNENKKEIEKVKSDEVRSGENGALQNEWSKANADPFEEISFDDGNNNCKGEESTGKKEGIRKTRFSSEVTIEPKAYFQTGTDVIVTMPPSSDDDVFQEKNNQTSSSLVILNAKPADQNNGVHPDTFYPLTIFTCMFCCPMIGLFAIYKSYSVKKLNSKGEFFEAREASEHARQLGILTLIVGFFFVFAIISIAVLVATLA